MSKLSMTRTRIVGLGSPHADDQVGWLICDQLANEAQLEGRVHRLASPWDLPGIVQSTDDLVVVDACDAGLAPGTLTWVDFNGSVESSTVSRTSCHGASLKGVLDLAEKLDRKPASIRVLTVQIESTQPNQPISPPILQVVPEAVRMIVDTLAIENSEGNPF